MNALQSVNAVAPQDDCGRLPTHRRPIEFTLGGLGRYDEPISEIERVSGEQCTMGSLPLTRSQISLEVSEASPDVAELREAGHGRPDGRIQVRMRTTPISSEKPVSTIVRDWNIDNRNVAQFTPEIIERRTDAAVDAPNFWEVVGEPESGERGIVRKDHGASTRDPTKLLKSFLRVGPMMNGQNRQRGVERRVAKWQRRGGRSNDRRRGRVTLANHGDRRLDGDDGSVIGFVRSGTRTHVHNACGVAKAVKDRRRNPRIGLPEATVSVTDRVVEFSHCCSPSTGEILVDQQYTDVRIIFVATRLKFHAPRRVRDPDTVKKT